MPPQAMSSALLRRVALFLIVVGSVLAAPHAQQWDSSSSGTTSGSWDGSTGSSGGGSWDGSTGGSWDGSTGSDSGWTGEIPVIPPHYNKVRVAHAVLASTAWLIFFPLGAILIRTVETGWDLGDVRIHVIVQATGSCIFVAAAGMGIWMAKVGLVLGHYHPIMGMALLGCLFIQPMTELLNAKFYQRYPKVIFLAHVHIWFGRLLLTAGIIQGGLGFAFSASLPYATVDWAPRIVYGVLAVVVWILYVSFAIVWPEFKHTIKWARKRKNKNEEDGQHLRERGMTDASAPSAIIRPQKGRKNKSGSE